MQTVRMSAKNSLLVIIFLFILIPGSSFSQTNTFEKMKLAMIHFINSYEPVYVNGDDTLVVSTFQIPDDELNQYLLNSSKKRDFRLVPYAMEILRIQHDEHIHHNGMDYPLDSEGYKEIGYIELIRKFLKLSTVPGMYLGPTYLGEILMKLDRKGIRPLSN